MINKKYHKLAFITIIIISTLTISCSKSKETIKIGFANTLTGKASTWGLNSRNGAMLAMDEWNESGGINGKQIEMIYRDDKANGDEALIIDQELIDLGVDAIIGHYLSTVSLKIVPLINQNDIVMISTAASTTALSGVDDNFFRLVLSNNEIGASLGEVSHNRLKIKNVAIVYDLSNPGYSNSFLIPYKKAFEDVGGNVISEISFGKDKVFSAPKISEKIIKMQADGVCLITNAIHGALICQHLRKNKSSVQIVASGWTYSDPNFISNGGNAVNGVISVNEYNGDSENQSFIDYKNRYFKRFGDKSTHPDKVGYEAAQILFTALAKNNDPVKLKETILEIQSFDGVDGKININEFGDSQCEQYLREIKNGKIVTIDNFKSGDITK